MNKTKYKKKRQLERIKAKRSDLSLLTANATQKVLEAMGPLNESERSRVFKCVCILHGVEFRK